MCNCNTGDCQDFGSPQSEDQDGSILLTDTILQLLSQLIYDKNLNDLTETEICTMDTLVYIVPAVRGHIETCHC